MSRLAAGPEFDFIRTILQRTRNPHPLIRVGPGDDCAIVGDLAISTDASVEGVHFRRDWLRAEEIGWRAAAAALSDLAAVAARPIGVLVSTVVPNDDQAGFAQNVMNGVIDAAESIGAVLLGGDTTGGELFMLDVVVIGQTERPLLRSTARAGDEVWVTGRLGGSAAAVSAWRSGQEPNQKARARYAHPLPRIREALWLRERVELHALIDLSDGLHGDVAHIAAASNCRVTIEAATLPIDESAGADMRSAVGGGEDFELCLTAEAGAIESIRAEFEREMKLPLTRVGNITAGSGVWQRESDGTVQLVESGGFQHFQGYR